MCTTTVVHVLNMRSPSPLPNKTPTPLFQDSINTEFSIQNPENIFENNNFLSGTKDVLEMDVLEMEIDVFRSLISESGIPIIPQPYLKVKRK